jgi:hypothetical protein
LAIVLHGRRVSLAGDRAHRTQRTLQHTPQCADASAIQYCISIAAVAAVPVIPKDPTNQALPMGQEDQEFPKLRGYRGCVESRWLRTVLHSSGTWSVPTQGTACQSQSTTRHTTYLYSTYVVDLIGCQWAQVSQRTMRPKRTQIVEAPPLHNQPNGIQSVQTMVRSRRRCNINIQCREEAANIRAPIAIGGVDRHGLIEANRTPSTARNNQECVCVCQTEISAFDHGNVHSSIDRSVFEFTNNQQPTYHTSMVQKLPMDRPLQEDLIATETTKPCNPSISGVDVEHHAVVPPTAHTFFQ